VAFARDASRKQIRNQGATHGSPAKQEIGSKRRMHRSHDFLTNPPLAVEPTTGENATCVTTSVRTVSIAQEGCQDQGRLTNNSPAFGCPMAQLKG